MNDLFWMRDGDSLFDDYLVSDVEADQITPGDMSELQSMQADDVTLTNYLVGTSKKKKTNSNTSAAHLAWQDGEAAGLAESKRPVIVFANNGCNKGDSNSKQAIAARENRQRKKQHVIDLEQSVERLEKENLQLKTRDAEQKLQITDLEDQVRYLKNVIANDSALSTLLKNINKSSGLEISSSLLRGVEKVQDPDVISKSTPRPGQKRKQTSPDMKEPNSTDGQNSKSISLHKAAKTSLITRSSSKSKTASKDNNNGQSRCVLQTSVSADEAENTKHSAQEGLNAGTVRNGNSVISCTERDSVGCQDEVGGICLHVLGKSVSIEFCSACNQSAIKTSNADHTYHLKN